jgi:integrase
MAAQTQKGFFPDNGVRRSTFWFAAIHAAYSTGLRRGDLLRVNRDDIDVDGKCIVVQSKTGYRVVVRFSPEAIEAIQQMDPEENERSLPWPFHENSLSIQFREIILPAAGVSHGCWKWLRRSAGSYAESVQPGTGSKALGHRSMAVFNGHYNDESISVAEPVSPPPIARRAAT